MSLSVSLFPNSYETANPSELKFWAFSIFIIIVTLWPLSKVSLDFQDIFLIILRCESEVLDFCLLLLFNLQREIYIYKDKYIMTK